MHPENPYIEPPDFHALALAYPPLKPYVSVPFRGKSVINFKDPMAHRYLTEALLARDFNISLTLRDDRLCPPVSPPVCCHDIQDAHYYFPDSQQDILRLERFDGQDILGIDIGTGSTAIYPLLGCKLNNNWSFIVTEIDGISAQTAQLNIDKNGLNERIKLIQPTAEQDILLPLHLSLERSFDFSMCNPPFYGSLEEIRQSANTKEYEPNSICSGADVEMITPGGEQYFVSRMITESLQHTTKCRWYSSMLGKLSSISKIVAFLRRHEINNYAVTEFIQGQTRRWAVAWSFGDIRLPDSIARISNPALNDILPPRNCLRQSFPRAKKVAALEELFRMVCSTIDGIKIMSSALGLPPNASDTLRFRISAASDTWSRKARRRKANNQPCTPTADQNPMEIYVCIVQQEKEDPCIEYTWVRGCSRSLFESFSSHVSRKVGTVLADM